MLEIMILLILSRNLGSRLRVKGYAAGPFQVLMVVLWLIGEVFGGVLGYFCSRAIAGHQGNLPLILACAIGGGLLGATSVFALTDRLPHVRISAPVAEQDHFSPCRLGDSDDAYRPLADPRSGPPLAPSSSIARADCPSSGPGGPAV